MSEIKRGSNPAGAATKRRRARKSGSANRASRVKQWWGDESPETQMFAIKWNFGTQLKIDADVFGCSKREPLAHAIKEAAHKGHRVALLAYRIPNNRGLINPEVFLECWKRCGKPLNFFDLKMAK